MTDAIRPTIRALLAGAASSLLLVVSAPAQAAPCAQEIIDDWRDNAGVIAGTYPVACYRQAIAALPDDARNYSTAAEDIRRALAARLRGETDPGPASTGSDTGGSGGANAGGDGGGGDSGTREPAGEAPTDEGSGAETTAQEPPSQEGSEERVAAPADDLFDQGLGDGSSSLPTPVIALLAVVGALALAGCVWLVRRQLGRR